MGSNFQNDDDLDIVVQTYLGAFLPLDSCLMNASGAKCVTKEEIINLINCPDIGSVVTKTTTAEARMGNPHPRWYENEILSLNSMGLPNLGYEQYSNIKPVDNTTIIFSLYGGSQQNVCYMMEKIKEKNTNTIFEINLSCPNLGNRNLLGYQFDEMEDYLRKINEKHSKFDFGLKLPPYNTDEQFEKVSTILLDQKIDFITCINSPPCGLIIDGETESTVIHPRQGFGGIGGAAIKPFALANVRKFYTNLDDKVAIIGCGGITNGMDAFEHILCGASAVQIGTQLMKEGISCFSRIRKELIEIIKKKKYSRIEDFRGKLKIMEPKI